MVELTESTFDEFISSGVCLIDFWAPWCGPCRMLAPIVEEIANELPDYKVAKVNVDDCPHISRTYNVMSIPTLIFFKDGQPMHSSVGVVAKTVIKEKLQSL